MKHLNPRNAGEGDSMELFDKDDKPAGETAFRVGMKFLGVKPPIVAEKGTNGIQAGSDWVGVKKRPDEMDVAIWGGKAK